MSDTYEDILKTELNNQRRLGNEMTMTIDITAIGQAFLKEFYRLQFRIHELEDDLERANAVVDGLLLFSKPCPDDDYIDPEVYADDWQTIKDEWDKTRIRKVL